MKNYNEELKRIYYWCNSMGEINAVTAPTTYVGEESDLPERARVLYQRYMGATSAPMYVVSANGEYGLMIELILDSDWIETTFGKGVVSKEILHAAGKEVTSELEQKYAERHVVAYYGEDSDPDGDEALFFIPYTTLVGEIISSDALNKCIDGQSDAFYLKVENRIWKKLAGQT